MIKLFKEYTPTIQRFSVDECFLDFTGTEHLYRDYIKLAHEIKNRVLVELGFSINIGISNNKLLAKMASDFKKPGLQIWEYANGIENSPVTSSSINVKGIGNSTTIPCDSVNACRVVSVSIKDNKFFFYSRQKKLDCPLDTTNEIVKEVYYLFERYRF